MLKKCINWKEYLSDLVFSHARIRCDDIDPLVRNNIAQFVFKPSSNYVLVNLFALIILALILPIFYIFIDAPDVVYSFSMAFDFIITFYVSNIVLCLDRRSTMSFIDQIEQGYGLRPRPGRFLYSDAQRNILILCIIGAGILLSASFFCMFKTQCALGFEHFFSKIYKFIVGIVIMLSLVRTFSYLTQTMVIAKLEESYGTFAAIVYNDIK